MNNRRLRFASASLAAATSVTMIAACSSSGGSNGSGSYSNVTFTTISPNTTITAGAPMNPFNATSNVFPSFDSMTLGWNTNNSADPTQEYPGLAQSWSLSANGESLTVHLQPGAKWSDGKPVTATDVVDSAAIWFAEGLAAGYNLGTVKADNSTTVTFTQAPGADNNMFATVLGESSGSTTSTNNWIVPSFEYGKMLPANIWSTIATSLGTGAGKTAAVTALTNLGKTIAAYAPKTDISAGPFYIKRLNNSQALLVKNPDFYAASKVHVGNVVMDHDGTNQQIASLLESSSLDTSPFVAMSSSVSSQIVSAGNKQITWPALVASAIAFDENDSPYNNIKVRQALAYVLNRTAIQTVGEPVVGTASQTTIGAVSAALPDYLTSSQESSLNSYATSTATATSLLQGAGLTKKGGQWYLPNGKAWTITLPVAQGFSDWADASSVIKSELDSFGIPTTITTGPQWTTYQFNNLYLGKYPVAWWLIALGPGANSTFSRIYGKFDGYVGIGSSPTRYPTGNPAAYNFFNTPNTVAVPGVGTVNPGSLTAQLATLNLSTPAGLAEQKTIASELVRTINYEVPVVQLWDYRSLAYINSKRFSDFPTSTQMLGQNPGVWMANGYLQAK
jgi:peptide/nickel transport system substrate-binding protein